MSGVTAILLAAGESRRMAPANKLELPVAGQPLLRHCAQVLLAARVDRLVVVLGHDAERARRLLAGLGAQLVYNERHRDGQMTSVDCGLRALAGNESEGVMICLADQPLLTPADITALMDAFRKRVHGSIVVPTYRGRRGNPIVLANLQRAAILAGGRNLGCRRLIERNPELVTTVEMNSDHVVFDLDTPQDYAELQRRLGDGVPPARRPTNAVRFEEA